MLLFPLALTFRVLVRHSYFTSLRNLYDLHESHRFESLWEADAALGHTEEPQQILLRTAGNGFAIPTLAQTVAVNMKLSRDRL